jgi:acetyl-CoA acetyltransferase
MGQPTGDGAMTTRRGYRDAVVIAPVSAPYRRFSPESAHWWIAAALRRLLESAGLSKEDLDGLALSSFTLAPDTIVGVCQHLGLSPRYLDSAPMGGAGAIVSLRRAARAVEAGDADIVACIGADTNQVDSFRRTIANFSRFAQDAAYPYGAGGPNASFALITAHYMRRFGARREDFGKLCVAQRRNAMSYPHALLKTALTLEDYLSARPIADPLVLFDCVLPCAGAEAFLVTRADIARSLRAPAARITATIERHNAFPDDPVQERGGWAVDRDELYAMAGLSPDRVDVLETYDDYPVISMMQIENLGFCAKGEGPEFVRSHEFTIDGDFPLNTSGGQLSVGQAGAAGGHLGLVEALRQVTGQTAGAAVPCARIALVSGFGMINYDRGVCSVAAILVGEGA